MAVRRSLFALPLLCLSLALAGCENMDPAYWLPDNKKKLPGERREVFPEGIPGVVQGVPPELIKGNAANQSEIDAAATAPQPEPPPVEEKPRPARRKVVRPIQPPPEDAQPQQQAQPRQQQPASRQAQPAQSGGASWPSPQPQATQQQPQAPAASAWPSPPASGTFTR